MNKKKKVCVCVCVLVSQSEQNMYTFACGCIVLSISFQKFKLAYYIGERGSAVPSVFGCIPSVWVKMW